MATSLFASRDAPTDALEQWVDGLPRDHNVEIRNETHRIVDSGQQLGWAEPILEPIGPASPAGHRSGTCFEVESTEMREACVESIGAYLETDAVVHEVRHQRNAYHTDLVYADIDPDALERRTRAFGSEEPLHDPLQRFKTWWYIYEHGPKPKPEAVENGLYSDARKNRKHITWLLNNGYLALSATDCLTAVMPPSIANLHAVELKRRDWETALEQAARARRCEAKAKPFALPTYQYDRWGYADYAWVALDAGAIGPALEHADRFREEGVGLLAIAEGGTVVSHIDAEHRPRGRYTRDRAYVESEVWDRIDAAECVQASEDGSDGEGAQATLGLVTDGSGGES
ncbi:hypothetical protein A6E15_19220 [Natrinema saccharevitans]|uniref:Uncharacterized protein n=1 Tax=Natrinema saccharevitans TaxID=301967 RepID=A0A1S8AR59_9EURY|nr:hypothetical protein [Natrinema saccharevitans]OLZ39096.1 hypothetical protein A6E15_19220 [Natrinema saccharevitans]